MRNSYLIVPKYTGLAIVESHVDARQVRQFRNGSWAVNPVPLEYDGRAGNLAYTLLLENDLQEDQHNVTLARLRLDDYIDIYWQMNYDNATQTTSFFVKWYVPSWSDKIEQNVAVESAPTFIHDGRYHSVALLWDRIDEGKMEILVDGVPTLSKNVTRVAAHNSGQELWINANNEHELDTGLRARVKEISLFNRATVIGGSSLDVSAPHTMASLHLTSKQQLWIWDGAIIAVFICAVGIALYCGRAHRRESEKEAAYFQLPEADIGIQSIFRDDKRSSGSESLESSVEMATVGGKRAETVNIVSRGHSTSP